MFLYITNADTELLTIRTIADDLLEMGIDLRALSTDHIDLLSMAGQSSVIILRLLGGRTSFEAGINALTTIAEKNHIPLLCFSGESIADPELLYVSTVSSGILGQAFEYLVSGGLKNYENFFKFISDTVLFTGLGFESPEAIPEVGIFSPMEIDLCSRRAVIVFYRAHLISGNTLFVESLRDEIARHGISVYPVYCYSLRGSIEGSNRVFEVIKELSPDLIITTVLAGGSMDAAGQSWDISQLKEINVPIIQAIVSSSSRDDWQNRVSGLVPLDVTMQVAIPEFDGRIVSVPFSFKEIVDNNDGFGSVVSAYRADPERVRRVAGIAKGMVRLREKRNEDKKIAIVLSAYPTKRSRLGNAVGLDTPSSVIELLKSLSDAGYTVSRIPENGDALMAELMETFNYDVPSLSFSQANKAEFSLGVADYLEQFESFGDQVKQGLIEHWGEPPGSVYLHDSSFIFPGVHLGNVFIAIQPPRGFGENPIAIYHSPDLPPTHHYMAFYRMIESKYDADAIIHVGKHGTLEWLPGKSLGMSNNCYSDQAIGSVPLIYPFVVNDPGEGTQAKRRAHAVIVDHMVPPLTRADTYDELAKLETLLDAHARYSGMDPSKLPSLRREIWDVLREAEIVKELRLQDNPDFENSEFDDLIGEIDGYLCEIKDAQIRGGLHILGQTLDYQAEVDMLAALTRIGTKAAPSLRSVVANHLNVDLNSGKTKELDKVANEIIEVISYAKDSDFLIEDFSIYPETYREPMRVLCQDLVPRLRATHNEIESILSSLDGRYVESGPSGAPSRGMSHVLPTGRNFYSIDPKAIPSIQSWEVGKSLADALIERYLSEEGKIPTVVGIVVWGTAAMRTAGDDISQTLALIGVRPIWDLESGRVVGTEVIPREILGRPRVDVTLRISGFFRDAFPHVIALLEEAFSQASQCFEPDNPLYGDSDAPRIFGPKPGAYGSGILPLIEGGNWRSSDDLAKVYMTWSGYSYSSKEFGKYDPETMESRFKRIQIASKNQDNREHDIFDSDDYMQDHGGMIAAIRHLTGTDPKSYFGDSADPSRPKMKSLAEEAAKVVRSRVLNPKWIDAMKNHGYKGAFEMAATVDYLFGYDATAGIIEDWMYERVTSQYVADPRIRKFFEESNPDALTSIAERLLEASQRGLWNASSESLAAIKYALLEAESWEETR